MHSEPGWLPKPTFYPLEVNRWGQPFYNRCLFNERILTLLVTLWSVC